MRDEDYKMTAKDVIIIIVVFSALISGTILCFVWEEYGVLIGFGFCWLLVAAYFIRAVREAADYMSRKR